MQTIYIMIGFSGSGKSTWAIKMADSDLKTVILNKDMIREMMKGHYVFDEELESVVKGTAGSIMASFLISGLNVIVDETNLTKYGRIAIVDHAKSINPAIHVVYVWCDESANNLANRMTNARGYSEEQWSKVISGQISRFEIPTESEGYDQLEMVSI